MLIYLQPVNPADVEEGGVVEGTAAYKYVMGGPVATSEGEGTDIAIGKWCVVEYEGKPYQTSSRRQTSRRTDCMCCIGPNRFFWPVMRDLCWYSFERVMSIID
ncbi:hypothetical protein LSAT2_014412 [Lamellibrachia satsuma]|nr:hypothetical protein LSAT2_014412 [Lamellibrachia satsuma]